MQARCPKMKDAGGEGERGETRGKTNPEDRHGCKMREAGGAAGARLEQRAVTKEISARCRRGLYGPCARVSSLGHPCHATYTSPSVQRGMTRRLRLPVLRGMLPCSRSHYGVSEWFLHFTSDTYLMPIINHDTLRLDKIQRNSYLVFIKKELQKSIKIKKLYYIIFNLYY